MYKKEAPKILFCDKCEQPIEVDYYTTSVTCPDCVVRENLQIYPEWIKDKKSKIDEQNRLKKPRGWHWLNLFVDAEGTVFRKGKECPEEKGTLPITVFKESKPKRNKLSKRYKETEQRRLLIEVGNKKKKIIKLGLERERCSGKRDKAAILRTIRAEDRKLIKIKKELRKFL